jgi:protein-tyrosine-phosphatase
VSFAKLYDRKTPLTSADLLNDRVVPFFEGHDLVVSRVLTDRGTEYCGRPESHDYELYLAIENIDHTRTKVKSPQTNGICERFHKTVLEEFYRVAFRKKLYSKSWDEYAAPGAPKMDFVFTVCDNAAGEVCPFWPGQPMTAHWGIEDPAAVEGSDIDKQRAFNEAFRYLRNRIAAFTSLPVQSISKLALSARLKEIGRMEGSTSQAKGSQ